MSKLCETTFTSHIFAASTNNVEATAKEYIAPRMLTKSAVGIITDKSTLLYLSSSLHGLLRKHTFMEVLPFHYVDLLFQYVGSYFYETYEPKMIHGEIAKLT